MENSKTFINMFPHWNSAYQHAFVAKSTTYTEWFGHKVLASFEFLPIIGRLVFKVGHLSQSFNDSTERSNSHTVRSIEAISNSISNANPYPSTKPKEKNLTSNRLQQTAVYSVLGSLIRVGKGTFYDVSTGRVIEAGIVGAFIGSTAATAFDYF